jgi:DNA-binding NarL/FixJ family response regulator
MCATVPIVEDHDGVRRSLRDWLQAEFPQCRMIEASTSEEAVTIAQATSPRVVLMDTVPSQMDGIEAVRQVKVSVPTAKVVVLAIHDAEAVGSMR